MQSKLHHAHVVHHTRGRIRLKLHAGKDNAPLLHEIRQHMKARRGIKDVDVNSTTGSILVHYDPSEWQNSDAEIRAAAEASGVFSIIEPEEIGDVKKEAEFLAEHSDIARGIFDYVSRLNQQVKIATNNAVDLNVIVPAAAAIYAFFEMESETATPLWLTLGIFSFNSFVGLHSHTKPPPQ